MADKVTIVALYCGIRTGHFGQGSFYRALMSMLQRQDDFGLAIISTDDADVEFVTQQTEVNIPILRIPRPENQLFITCEDNVVQKQYAKRVAEIIAPFLQRVSTCHKFIFIANSCDYLHLSIELKRRFYCKIAYIHHSWFWKQVLNIEDETFAGLIKNSKNDAQIHQDNPFTQLIFQQLEMARNADQVITVTKQSLNLFTCLLGDNLSIKNIYNGVCFEENILVNPQRIREKYGIAEHEKILLFSGRVKSDKGITVLLESFDLLEPEFPSLRLVIIGGGDTDYFSYNLSEGQNKIIFTGEVERNELDQWYQIADIGIIPSLHEQCSFTALEMRKFKIPVVVSAVDGLDEMYHNFIDSVKIPVSVNELGIKEIHKTQLASGLRVLLEDHSLRSRLAENAYEQGKKLYSIELMHENYKTMFLELINGSWEEQ